MRSFRFTPFRLFGLTFLPLIAGCSVQVEKEEEAMAFLLAAMDTYESAWANGDFLTVESFFAENAKRLHSEPHVWDRAEIKRYFEERAANTPVKLASEPKADWKAERDYLEIRVEGNIAYDIFTTERFKAFHIWEKQSDGAWKIIYDVGMLNTPEPPAD